GFGNERLTIQPCFVDGFVWFAIGAAGLDGEEDMEGRSRESVEESLAVMERIMAPSERQRAAAILAAWPETLPPERPIRAVEGEGPYEDESSYVIALLQYLRGDDVRAFGRLFRTDEAVQTRGFAELSRRAESGEEEAEFAVAWCRLIGLGTERDHEAVLPYLRQLAEEGDGRALMALVHEALERDDEAAMDDLRQAAEAGHPQAMLAIASQASGRGDEQGRIEWVTRAAKTGSVDAVGEMIRIGESKRDSSMMLQWLAAFALAREGTAAGYRSRLVMAMLVDEMEDDEVRAALEAGERWAVEHGGN
ncbi:MAG: hypothetical protein LUC93_14020, partial [Planctomycetaceae bacterium]|nr:hypothetical protein [Planctomycetaceae bacterium]